MRKLLPYLRLALFCIVLFGAGGVIVLLKQERLKLGKKHEEPAAEKSAAASGEHGATEQHAALPGLTEPRSPETAPGEAARRQAIASGRALFSVPESISSAEATELLNELRRQKRENEERRSALDQREKELTLMEQDIEARRTALVAMAEKLNASLPDGPDSASAGEAADPETILKIGAMLAGMQPEVAARTLTKYTPEQAAKVLLSMKETKAAAVLGAVPEENLQKITDALLREKSGQ